jgi:hypothetical protein
MSSYVNIFQEFQKVMYRKKVMEEAKQRADQGIEESMGMSALSYLPMSPEYSASSPVYGSVQQQQQPMGFGAAAAFAQQQQQQQQASPLSSGSPQYSSIFSPIGSPTMLVGQPTNVVIPVNPLQPVMPVQAQAAQGILSVEPPKAKEGDKEEEKGKKTVMVNLGQ